MLKGILESNPAKEVEKYPEHKRDRRPTDAEVEAVKGAGDIRISAFIDLKEVIPARQGDMLRLRWLDCLEEGVSVSHSKFDGLAVIYAWTDALREALNRFKHIQELEG